MVIVSIFISFVLLLYVIFIVKEIKSINAQMHYIFSNDTNAEITISTNNFIIKKHVLQCNQLIQQNKQLKIQQQKSELELHQIMTSLTHDLKTPLTVASGYTQLLLKDEAHHELASKIDKSLQSVNYYLNGLIDYNLIQEKKFAIVSEPLLLSQFLLEQLFQYYEQFEQKGIQVDLQIENNIVIHNDKIILKRIIDNIMSNLLKYAKAHITVILKCDHSEIAFICKNDYYGEITKVEQLPLRFHTQDNSRHNKSMGIGLHNVQELTKIINGSFSIKIEDNLFITKINLKNA